MVLTSLRRFRRMLKAAGHVGEGEKLEREGRLGDARLAFTEAIRASEAEAPAFMQPALSSTRLVATMGLSRIAARLNDAAEATRFARAGLALWSEARLEAPATRKLDGFAEWEAWARAYLEQAGREKAPHPGGMKVEFIPDGAVDTPLILFSGRDRLPLKALRAAIARIDRGPFALHAVEGISPVGGCHVTAALGDRDRGVRRLGDFAFEWVMDAEGWAQVDGLLEPFDVPSERNGFQYLSRVGEVMVLISPDGRW